MQNLNITDFIYDLPQERIALHPLAARDESRLLVYQRGEIRHAAFRELSKFLPENSFLFFNDTRVIPARMHFQKDTGADIEIFLLAPEAPSRLLAQAMEATSQCAWHCTIGNLKRWKEGSVLSKELGDTKLEATLLDRNSNLVGFKWTSGISFAEIVERSGETPLPPYLKRKPEKEDHERYQTVYAQREGAVAAPTAGLHFTDRVFEDLNRKKTEHDFLTLHVSAGTFQPIKADNPADHVMHTEQVVVCRRNIDNLMKVGRFFTAVGTTSMRTLESIYWFGVKLHKNKGADFRIRQEDPYHGEDELIPTPEAIRLVASYMDDNSLTELIGETAIFIRPGYRFRVCRGLITNFHQPASTLMLLVAAFVGPDWRRIYDEALKNDYRFLSYGDSSLLIP